MSEGNSYFRLEQSEYDTLTNYNAEVRRGIMHTPQWRERMAGLQDRFNRQIGYTAIPIKVEES